MADYVLSKGSAFLAIRLYDLFIAQYGNSRKAEEVKRSVESVLVFVPSKDEIMNLLRRYLDFTPHSDVRTEIQIAIDQMKRELKQKKISEGDTGEDVPVQSA